VRLDGFLDWLRSRQPHFQRIIRLFGFRRSQYPQPGQPNQRDDRTSPHRLATNQRTADNTIATERARFKAAPPEVLAAT